MRTHDDYVLQGRIGAFSRWSKLSPEQRFWKNVEIKGPLDCWPWRGPVNCKTGYGKARFSRKHFSAHRLAYQFSNGPILEGFQICHHCDNRLCCNPQHLFSGSATDNMQDALKKGRLKTPNPPALSLEAVLRARALHQLGALSQADLAKLFNVSLAAMNRAIRGVGAYGGPAWH